MGACANTKSQELGERVPGALPRNGVDRVTRTHHITVCPSNSIREE